MRQAYCKRAGHTSANHSKKQGVISHVAEGQPSLSLRLNVSGDCTVNHFTRLTDLFQLTFAVNGDRLACLVALVIALLSSEPSIWSNSPPPSPGEADIGTLPTPATLLQINPNSNKLQPAHMAKLVLAFLPDVPYTPALDRTRCPAFFLVNSRAFRYK